MIALIDSSEATAGTPGEQASSSQPTIDERFREFDSANPWVYQELLHLAERWKQAGHDRCAIGMLWEVTRWERGVNVSQRDGEYKLNDHFRSRYARKIMDNNPHLSEMFETRRLRAA